ncbi:MAG: DUF3450 family protein [Planctomycetota bacterium]
MRAPKPKTQRALPILALIGILGAPMALVAWNTPQETDSVALEEARESLEQLYETRRLISAENRDWITGKELLRDQIRLAQKEMQTLRQNIKDKQAEMEQTLTQVEELKSQSAEATAVGDAMDEQLATWESRLRNLLPRLPGPLQEDLRGLAQSLPKEGAEVSIDRSKRAITVLFLLSQISKFQNDVTVSSEIVQLPSGVKAEVRTLYLGISQGYYVTQSGDAAAVGAPGDAGWSWHPRNDAAAAIQQAIAVQANEAPATYVSLPLGKQ